jgi:hypothetical protein
MTREEYEKLVKSSLSFREMDRLTQERILAAEGEDMESYIKLFLEEKELMVKAYRNFQNESDKVVVDYIAQVQKKKHEKLAAAEESVQKKDDDRAEELINKL